MSVREEHKAVYKLAENYLEAGRRGDVKLMKTVFHDDATIFGHFEGDVLGGPISLLYEWMESFGAANEIDGVILSVDVEGTIASVKVQADNWCGYNFTDFLNLLKTDNGWVIINKMFNHT